MTSSYDVGRDKILKNLEYLKWKRVPQQALDMARSRDPGEGTLLSELFLQTKSKRPGLKHLEPGVMSSILAGGMLGTGVGYGAGAVASMFTPEDWDKEKLKRNAAIAGGLIGTVPGLQWGALNLFANKPFFSNDFAKNASDSGLFAFNVDDFTSTVWNDSRVAKRLDPQEQAALTGFVTGAANLPGKPTGNSYVTPLDMGRMALGMGSGYMAGAFAGRAIGSLMGMPEEKQEKLKNIGMWAGLAKSLVPILF